MNMSGKADAFLHSPNYDWYICSYCKKTFPSKQQCSSHKKTEHRKEMLSKKSELIQNCVGKKGQNNPKLVPSQSKSELETELTNQKNDKRISNPVNTDEKMGRQIMENTCSVQNLAQDHDNNNDKDKDGEENPCLVMIENGGNLNLNSHVENPVASKSNSKSHFLRKLKLRDCGVDEDKLKRAAAVAHKYSVQVEDDAENQNFTGVSWSCGIDFGLDLDRGESDELKALEIRKFGHVTSISGSRWDVDVAGGDKEEEDKGGESEQKLDDADSAPSQKIKRRRNTGMSEYPHITVLTGPPPLFSCTVCLKTFKTKTNIHYHKFCRDGEKPFKCNSCGRRFITKDHFEYHQRTHTGERPFKCPVETCGKGFNQQGKLTRHLRSHTGEKPFDCEQCERKFENRQLLKSHVLIHTGEQPYPCQVCGNRFRSTRQLKRHKIIHTGERPFSCDTCGKKFGRKCYLELHQKTHVAERPFRCQNDGCTRTFVCSRDFQRHQLIHIPLRPFKCWICGTAFKRKDYVKRHIRHVHRTFIQMQIQKKTK